MGQRLTEATPADLERIIADFARGAELAAEAGIDSLEIHMGHNYLISSFLSPKLNRRSDDWGGTIEGRVRLAREVATAVRRADGRQVAVTAKLNMDDGVKGGLGLDDAIEAARLLDADGNLDALELTGGSSLANPMYLFRGDAPRKDSTASAALDEGFSFIALGRALLMEPGIINRWAAGDEAPSACTHCNRCMPSIYTGTRCVLVDEAPAS